MDEFSSLRPLSQQRRFQNLQRIFPGIEFVFDENGRYVSIDSAADTDRLLYCDSADLQGKSLHDVFPESRADHFLDCIERTLRSGEVQTIEYQMDVQAGSRWFHAHLVPFSPSDSETKYVQVFTRDITGEKEREETLEKTRRRFTAIFEDPNILVGLLEPDGTVIDINETALDYLDAELSDVTGEPFWETPWFTGDARLQAEVERLATRAAEGEYVEFELDLSTAVSRDLVISGVFRPVFDEDGEVVSLVISDRDITERKRRERELRQNKRRFEAVFNDPHVLLAILDAEGTVQRANQTALDLVDATPETVTGEPFWQTPWWNHSTTSQIDLQQWVARAAAGEYVEYEAEHYTADGERILVDGFLRPVTEDGEVVSIIASANDVTRRKRHQQRLQVLYRVLRHNLRNSLNIIQGLAEQLRGSSEDSTNEERFTSRTRAIEEEAADLSRLVTKIQRFKRIEETKTIQSVSLRELLSDLRAAAEEIDPACNIESTLPSEEVEVPRSIEMAIFEAVENALEHHDGDGETASVELSARVDRDSMQPQVVLRIEDDGPGIPRVEAEPLQSGTESDLRHTSRIGLWLMKWSVENHGGELSITSSSDRGAVITITFPLGQSSGP